MSKLVQIPEDVHFLIVDHLDRPSKFRLTRTCHYFRHLLEPILYRHIKLGFTDCNHRLARLHRTLVERPSLIPHIRSYYGHVVSILPLMKSSFFERRIRRKKNKPITREEALEKAVYVFTQATNVVELEISSPWDWTSESNTALEPIRRAVSKMSLKRLIFWQGAVEVDRILRNQPELEKLEVGWDTSGLHLLDTTDLPKLKSLTAPLREAVLLVPGRPIEKLHVRQTFIDPDYFNDLWFRKLSLSTGHITEFFIHLFCMSGDEPYYVDERLRVALQVISRNLTQLERLTIDVSGSVAGQVILEEVPAFRFLRSLTFLEADLTAPSPNCVGKLASDNSQGNGTIRQVPVLESWDDVFDHLKRSCPSLVSTKLTWP
ncbi:hypothetical protein FS837_012384 [Tulasnella sp. UAMH 9824]|nr:hypothetical protein FS837_012384 [Tulasnella sp. UAMH 9824]